MHLTMIDPAFQHVDGKLWAKVAFATREAGGTWHIDLATNTWARAIYPPGSPSAQAYDVVADSNDKLWMTDGKGRRFPEDRQYRSCRRPAGKRPKRGPPRVPNRLPWLGRYIHSISPAAASSAKTSRRVPAVQ